MLRKILLPSICLILAYGFWVSSDFKEISAGVAIFLFGMLSLEQGFRAFTGGALENILRKSTSKLWKSLGFGIITTTIMQSSSLVSVITISFLSAGLISLAAGIGIIFGANLGTTTGAWLVAGFGLKVKISAYAMPMLVFGVVLIFQKSKNLTGLGYILAGLGFLFLGIHHMKVGFESFKATIDLAQFALEGYTGLFVFCGIGVFATVVMQSSHATLVLIITALAAQQITYENALALAIGANIGTTITAILGSMSANEQGKRLALAHLIFNLATGFIAISLIYKLMIAVDSISLYVGIDAQNYTLKLAVFHTIFNLIGVLVMLPFINPLVIFLEKLFPTKRPIVDQPKYLTDSAIDFPETALKAVHQETLHVYKNATSIISHALGVSKKIVFSGSDLHMLIHQQNKVSKLDIDSAYNRSIKGIFSTIVAFISKADFTWQMTQSADLHHLREANQHIVEAVKSLKHLQKNMVHYINSDNIAMRTAYNELRINIISLLRDLDGISRQDDGELGLLSLDAIKVNSKDNRNEFHHKLSKLLQSDAITPTMGTSLMNDISYTNSIINNLIKAADTLFISRDYDTNHAVRSVVLNEEEMREISEMKSETEEASL